MERPAQSLVVRVRRLAAPSLHLALAGVLSFACSAPPGTTESLSAPGDDGRRISIDPIKPGASIVCRSEERGAQLWVLSAMNHKLATYPEFARAIDLERVSDCETANRYWDGYVEYSAEHPDFDADQPLPPSSDFEPTMPSTPPPMPDVSKIKGGEDGVVNHPIVELEFFTCSILGCPRADDTWIIQREADPPDPAPPAHDLRRSRFRCSGTFIAKNWILTAAHCISPVAVDNCMEHGDTLDECVPPWETWGFWTIRGTRPNLQGVQSLSVWARAYVMPGWVGRTLSTNDLTCEGRRCFDAALNANDDIALLYVPMDYDRSLFPNVENDGAKRLSFGTPEADWQLAFYGWGTDGRTSDDARVLRRGRSFFDQFDVRERRIDIRSTTARPFPCGGDSGGPMMHTGLTLDTNIGAQSGLEAIVGVTSAVFPDCAASPLPTNVTWWSTRMDHPSHKKFILDTMRRYPEWKNFSCASRGIVGIEAEECWGPPCTIDGRPQDGGCTLATHTCVRPGRAVGSEKRNCGTCEGTPQQGSCNCIVGQCLPR